MIAFEAYVNGKRLCRAGALDMTTLYASVAWIYSANLKGSPTSPKRAQGSALWLHLEGRARQSYRSWGRVNVKVGDVLRLRVVDAATCDEPVQEWPDDHKTVEVHERRLYQRLRKKYEKPPRGRARRKGAPKR